MDLKIIRKNIGISQQQACDFLKMPLRTYKRFETETNYKKSYKYSLFCDALLSYKPIVKSQNSHIDRKLKIVIAGAGYVGLSLACLLSDNYIVTVTDVVDSKIRLINEGESPFHDSLIEKYLSKKKKINAFLSDKQVYANADIVIIATPTNFDIKTNQFDTTSVESVIAMIEEVNHKTVIVIKSTVPLGFTNGLAKRYPYLKIIFSPEFLREGRALYDNLYPARIVVGYDTKNKKEALLFGNILKNESLNDAPLLLMKSEEAEAVKLFANAYLAMRVSFFNELDTYAETKSLNSNNIIKGISLDNRIGDFYNNPSFGYGGYCLPKDTIQLANSFFDIKNNNLIKAIVQSNETRKEYLTNQIIKKAIKVTGKSKEKIVIGVYLLSMKTDSDNYRSSSSLDIMKLLNNQGVKTIVYDPNYSQGEKDFNNFINECDFYITNRIDSKIKSIKPLIYTRDLFNRD